MGKKLKSYIMYIESLVNDPSLIKDYDKLKSELLIEIGFWQHERLIHLLVTILFSLLLMSMIIVSFFYVSLPSVLLFLLFLVLEVPYIRHYYILENGTQKLYRLYEAISKLSGNDHSAASAEGFGK